MKTCEFLLIFTIFCDFCDFWRFFEIFLDFWGFFGFLKIVGGSRQKRIFILFRILEKERVYPTIFIFFNNYFEKSKGIPLRLEIFEIFGFLKNCVGDPSF